MSERDSFYQRSIGGAIAEIEDELRKAQERLIEAQEEAGVQAVLAQAYKDVRDSERAAEAVSRANHAIDVSIPELQAEIARLEDLTSKLEYYRGSEGNLGRVPEWFSVLEVLRRRGLDV